MDKMIKDDPRKCFGNALLELARTDERILFVSCDSSLGAGAGPFAKEFPARHLEFGIAEQNAMGHAAGLAATGKVPFIAAYVPFVTYRCFEQIRNDVAKTALNVNIMGNNSGFSVSALGPTHTILEDVAALRALPNLSILSPADGIQYGQAPALAASIQGPTYIRISRIPCPRIYTQEHKMLFGKADILRQGSHVSLIASGTCVYRALLAAQALLKEGIEAELINLSTIKPLDEKTILESVAKTGKAVSIEEHSIIGGIGSAVADVLARKHPVPMEMIGVKDEYAVVGSYEELMEHYGLSGKKITDRIRAFLEGRSKD